GLPCLFLEHMEGGDLATRLMDGAPPLRQALEWAIQFSLGVAHICDTLGVVHRDIKPSNALLTATGIVKVADFGLSREAGQELLAKRADLRNIDPLKTDSKAVIGTAAYMAPEALTTPGKVDVRSDVYSFGCMLHELLTGHRLFEGAPDALLARLEPVQLQLALPEPVVAILQRCLELDPEQRYESFGELSVALQQAFTAVTGERFVAPDAEPHETADAFHNRGVSLANLGFYDAAADWYRKALLLEPDQPDTRVHLGDALLVAGRAEEAVEVFREALARNATSSVARMGLAKSLVAAGSLEAAVEALEPLRQVAECRIAASFMGASILEQLGREADAASWRQGVPERRQQGALDKVTLAEEALIKPTFRAMPFRHRQIKQVRARRGRFTPDGFVVDVAGESFTIPWREVQLVQAGRLREDGQRHYVLDVYMAAHLLRFDSREVVFGTLFEGQSAGSQGANIAEIMQRFRDFAPQCRLDPTLRELQQAGPVAIKRYNSLRHFEEHGRRLLSRRRLKV
ncbi:MAG: protein kinase domain-containing protein, partial [Candidatus Xenobia bacterium]